MPGVWQHDGTEWSLTAPVGFQDEAALQALAEEAPQMLPLSGVPKLVVVGREVQLGSGVADIVAVEPDGRPVIVEVKLARNAEARRAVVAQALTYAAFLYRLDPDVFEDQVLRPHLQRRGWDSLVQAMEESDQEGAFDSSAFRDGLAEALSTGAFRLVFVLDDAPAELIRLVGYLEAIGDNLTIDLVTVEAYEVAGSRVLIPQRMDPERAPAELQTSVTRRIAGEGATLGADDFLRFIDQSPGDQQTDLRTLADWAISLEEAGLAKLWTYNGRGRKTLLPYIPNEEAGLVTLWNDNGPAVQFWRSVFMRRAPQAMARVEAVIAPANLGQGTTTREINPELLDAVREAYVEAHSTTRAGFDWSTVQAAIERIPPGRWTTYGDLAELTGTAGIAVGGWIARQSDVEGAWRVLGADGKPRPDFRWSDPHDDRDVVDVLVSEGIEFGSNGAAESSQRLRRIDLEHLFAEPVGV